MKSYLGGWWITGWDADYDKNYKLIALKMHEITSLKRAGENNVIKITLEMSGVYKTKAKGTVYKHCTIADIVVSHERIG